MPRLQASTEPLSSGYDVAMLDLDGVVYVGARAVAGAAEAISAARKAGQRVVFITNNAARPPAEVAEHLEELGIGAEPHDVVTSSQAAARVLRDRGWEPAYVLGGEGLVAALEEVGVARTESFDEAKAVVTGYGPDVLWRDIMRAAVAIRDGVPWVASNTDLTFPAEFGVAPGHGTQVRMIKQFAGVDPVVAGKPEPPLLETTIDRCGAERPLMVGDRLDTDIAGARRIGIDTLLVMTGVTGLAEVVSAEPEQRPTFIAADLRGLLERQPAPETEGGAATLGGWRAGVEDGVLSVSGEGTPGDWWRVVASAAWDWLDERGEPAAYDGVVVPAAGGDR